MNDRVARGYDRLAPWYQAIEWLRFGGRLQTARIALLKDLPRCQRALFIGDGDGRLLQAFAAEQPECRVTSVDISAQMLARQRQRIGPGADSSQYQWVQADIRQYKLPRQRYDLIVTAFHLDCFQVAEIEALAVRLAAAVRPRGCWYVVDFAIPKRGWRRFWARFWTALMIAFFRWQTGLVTTEIVDLPELFLQHGWTVIGQRVSSSGLQFSMLLRCPP